MAEAKVGRSGSEFRVRPTLCQVGEALAALDPDERAYVQREGLDHPDARDGLIAEGFAERGHPVNMMAVWHHRRGSCRCRD